MVDKRVIPVLGVISLFLLSSTVPISIGSNVKLLNNITQSTNRGKTLYVGGSGPNNYTKIQDAIENSSNRDTVFVYSGTYYENINLTKSIELIGEDKNTTVIDGREHDDVVHVSGNKAKISGFTIKNSGQLNWPYWCGGVKILSNNTVIENNIIYNNYYGIVSFTGSNHTFSNNTIINNNSTGITTWDEGNDVISGNVISYNHGGMLLPYAGYHKVLNNFVNDNGGCGIGVCSNHFIVSGNTLWNDGFFIDNDCVNNVFYNNTVNGKPFIYLENIANQIITENAGQIILVRCENIQIIGQIISNTYSAIQILKSNNCLVKNCTFTNNSGGIYIENSNNTRVSNNIFNSNEYSGVSLFYSSKNTIVNNFVSNNEISLTGSCNGNSILNNTIQNSETGISLCQYNLDYATNNIIAGNNISGHNIGLYTWPCYYNIIYCNNFINNTHQVMSTSNNLFYYPIKQEGNYWDDYKERYPNAKPRNDKPSIWDTPYEISYNSYDNYPLVNPCTDFKVHARNQFRFFNDEFSSLLLVNFERFPIIKEVFSRLIKG